jgi:hypothetical protein
LRHVIGRAQAKQGFCGKNDLLPANVDESSDEFLGDIFVFFSMFSYDWITLYDDVFLWDLF